MSAESPSLTAREFLTARSFSRAIIWILMTALPSPLLSDEPLAENTAGFRETAASTEFQSAEPLPQSSLQAASLQAASLQAAALRELKKPLCTVSLSRPFSLTESGEQLSQPVSAPIPIRGVAGTEIGVGVIRVAQPVVRLPCRPVWFEDAPTERYGASYGLLTDARSAGLYFGRIPMAPYFAAADHSQQKSRRLPVRRADCSGRKAALLPAPTPVPSAVQAAAVLGLIFLVP